MLVRPILVAFTAGTEPVTGSRHRRRTFLALVAEPGQAHRCGAGWEAEVRSLYDGMVRIVVTPTWAKLIDFETTLPSAVEELVRRRDERQRG